MGITAQQAARDKMVSEQIEARGVTDVAVLLVMRLVPRQKFVKEVHQRFAYADKPLPLSQEQTISQPYIVAAMAEALELQPEDRVLEVGTGSGYAAAVLSRLASQVFTVERHKSLQETATVRLRQLGFDNVRVRHADGMKGWPEEAPFDAISVAAGGQEIPEALKEQLAVGGRLVMPVGGEQDQSLVLLTRTGPQSFHSESLGKVRFVPLLPGCEDV